jgi:protein-S-isoprenylcysteine O-methyltransferase Ste14
MSDGVNEPCLTAERERMASMLENWFQQRMKLSNKAFRFMFIPLIPVAVLALAFWFSYYIPVPAFILLMILLVSLTAWVVCLFIGWGILRKVRTGDGIMLRKIRASETPEKG